MILDTVHSPLEYSMISYYKHCTFSAYTIVKPSILYSSFNLVQLLIPMTFNDANLVQSIPNDCASNTVKSFKSRKKGKCHLLAAKELAYQLNKFEENVEKLGYNGSLTYTHTGQDIKHNTMSFPKGISMYFHSNQHTFMNRQKNLTYQYLQSKLKDTYLLSSNDVISSTPEYSAEDKAGSDSSPEAVSIKHLDMESGSVSSFKPHIDTSPPLSVSTDQLPMNSPEFNTSLYCRAIIHQILKIVHSLMEFNNEFHYEPIKMTGKKTGNSKSLTTTGLALSRTKVYPLINTMRSVKSDMVQLYLSQKELNKEYRVQLHQERVKNEVGDLLSVNSGSPSVDKKVCTISQVTSALVYHELNAISKAMTIPNGLSESTGIASVDTNVETNSLKSTTSSLLHFILTTPFFPTELYFDYTKTLTTEPRLEHNKLPVGHYLHGIEEHNYYLVHYSQLLNTQLSSPISDEMRTNLAKFIQNRPHEIEHTESSGLLQPLPPDMLKVFQSNTKGKSSELASITNMTYLELIILNAMIVVAFNIAKAPGDKKIKKNTKSDSIPSTSTSTFKLTKLVIIGLPVSLVNTSVANKLNHMVKSLTPSIVHESYFNSSGTLGNTITYCSFSQIRESIKDTYFYMTTGSLWVDNSSSSDLFSTDTNNIVFKHPELSPNTNTKYKKPVAMYGEQLYRFLYNVKYTEQIGSVLDMPCYIAENQVHLHDVHRLFVASITHINSTSLIRQEFSESCPSSLEMGESITSMLKELLFKLKIGEARVWSAISANITSICSESTALYDIFHTHRAIGLSEYQHTVDLVNQAERALEQTVSSFIDYHYDVMMQFTTDFEGLVDTNLSVSIDNLGTEAQLDAIYSNMSHFIHEDNPILSYILLSCRNTHIQLIKYWNYLIETCIEGCLFFVTSLYHTAYRNDSAVNCPFITISDILNFRISMQGFDERALSDYSLDLGLQHQCAHFYLHHSEFIKCLLSITSYRYDSNNCTRHLSINETQSRYFISYLEFINTVMQIEATLTFYDIMLPAHAKQCIVSYLNSYDYALGNLDILPVLVYSALVSFLTENPLQNKRLSTVMKDTNRTEPINILSYITPYMVSYIAGRLRAMYSSSCLELTKKYTISHKELEDLLSVYIQLLKAKYYKLNLPLGKFSASITPKDIYIWTSTLFSLLSFDCNSIALGYFLKYILLYHSLPKVCLLSRREMNDHQLSHSALNKKYLKALFVLLHQLYTDSDYHDDYYIPKQVFISYILKTLPNEELNLELVNIEADLYNFTIGNAQDYTSYGFFFNSSIGSAIVDSQHHLL